MSVTVESVEAFASRARSWLGENMPLLPPGGRPTYDDDMAMWARVRELQRRLWDGGFAGICFPREYGGLGLSPAHQAAFSEEALPFELPFALNIPTLSIIAATLVDIAGEEQKRRYLPPILRGEEVWVQFLSEPTGGSDLAGSLTRADRDGDVWILNGSKIWSSGAYAADFGLCLARTNWDVPKHRGLTLFIVDIAAAGVQVERIRQVDGSEEFCQEFFTDVVLPADAVVGQVDDGWTMAQRLLGHERTAVGGASPYVSGRMLYGEFEGPTGTSLLLLARELGRDSDQAVRQLIGEARTLDLAQPALVRRLGEGMASGALPPTHGSILRLFSGCAVVRKAELAVSIAGADAVAGPHDGSPSLEQGQLFLSRQAACLGGGSTEMSRNLISERVLGMPREWSADKDVPFRDVRKNVMPRHRGDA